jgi:dTDP-4-dehydrorhamnose reductase
MTKKILSSNDPIYMVDDQVGRLTYTYDLAVMLQTLLTTDKFGI